MREETLNGTTYRVGKLTAKEQWNVVRRLGAVIAAAGPAFQAIGGITPGDASTVPGLEDIFSAFGPVASAMGELSDENSDYVIGKCLSVVKCNKMGTTWADVANRHGQIMFDNISMATMLRLTLYVLQENLEDFLAELNGSTPATP